MKNFVFAALMLFFTADFVFGQLVITADKAAELAAEGNLSLKQEKLSLDEKQRNKQNTWNTFLPDITVSAGIGKDNEILKDSPESDWNGRVSGDVSLSLDLGVPYKINRIKQEFEAGELSYKDAVRNIEINVRKSFYELIIYENNIELMKQSIDAGEKRYNQALVNQKAGLVPELDVLNAHLSYASLLPEYETLQTEYLRKIDQFKIYLGLPLSEEIILSGDMDNLFSDKIVLDGIDSETESAELVLLRKNLAIAKEQKKETRTSSYFPSLSLGWDLSPVWNDISITDEYSDTGSLSATLAWNLNSFIPNSEKDLTLKKLDDSIKQLELQISVLELEEKSVIENLIRNIARHQNSIETLNMTAALAEKTLVLTEDAYRYGAKDILDVSEAEQNLREAKFNVLREKYSLIGSLMDLEYKMNLPFETLGR